MCSLAQLKQSQDALSANVKTLTKVVEANTVQQATTNETLAGLGEWKRGTERRLDIAEKESRTSGVASAVNAARLAAWAGAATLFVAAAGVGAVLFL